MRERERDLRGEGAGGGELVADEVAGGDVGNGEELGEAGGVGALADSRAAKEHPLDISALARRTNDGQRRRERR